MTTRIAVFLTAAAIATIVVTLVHTFAGSLA
jgi:hypothetical protein